MAISINTWQFLVYLVLLILTFGVTYGAMTQRINVLEDCSKIAIKDHDIVMVVQAKLDTMMEDIKEMKQDLKDLKRR